MEMTLPEIKTIVTDKAKARAGELDAGRQSADNILGSMANPAPAV